MRRLCVCITVLALLLCVRAAMASPVRVGILSKGGPTQAANCQAYVDGIVPLGTGLFDDLVTGQLIAALRDINDPTMELHLDATDVPNDLCTAEGVASTVAEIACTNALTVTNLKSIRDSDGLLLGFYWNCEKVTAPSVPAFWVVAQCP